MAVLRSTSAAASGLRASPVSAYALTSARENSSCQYAPMIRTRARISISPGATPMRPLTVLFMPESAYGPTNNCIGIGDVLRHRGHRVVFAAEASWKGRLEPRGFEEDLVDLTAPAEGGQD